MVSFILFLAATACLIAPSFSTISSINYDVISGDTDCPQEPKWNNPLNYIEVENNCHAYRVCDQDCNSYLRCCPFYIYDLATNATRQQIWDKESCSCIVDDPKDYCDDYVCETDEVPIPTVADPGSHGLEDDQCWVNGIVYEGRYCPDADDLTTCVVDVDGPHNAYIIISPSGVEPFLNEVVQLCPFGQYFIVDTCACEGTLPTQNANGYCINMDASDGYFQNNGDAPTAIQPTIHHVRQRTRGYIFYPSLNSSLEFPFFTWNEFWNPGFKLIIEACGNGVLLTNGKTKEESTLFIEVKSTEEGRLVEIHFDTLVAAGDGDGDDNGFQLSLPVDEDDCFALFIQYCHEYGTFLAIVTEKPLDKENIVSQSPPDLETSGEPIELRECPLVFGTDLDDGTTENWNGWIKLIKLMCNFQCPSDKSEDDFVPK